MLDNSIFSLKDIVLTILQFSYYSGHMHDEKNLHVARNVSGDYVLKYHTVQQHTNEEDHGIREGAWNAAESAWGAVEAAWGAVNSTIPTHHRRPLRTTQRNRLQRLTTTLPPLRTTPHVHRSEFRSLQARSTNPLHTEHHHHFHYLASAKQLGDYHQGFNDPNPNNVDMRSYPISYMEKRVKHHHHHPSNRQKSHYSQTLKTIQGMYIFIVFLHISVFYKAIYANTFSERDIL